jgi:hypothetical protein
MGKIIISPRILGENFGKVAIQHLEYYASLNKLNQSQIAKDLNGTSGDEYARILNNYFKGDLVLRMS